MNLGEWVQSREKVKIADNLIGSTAKYNNLTLVTRNIADLKDMGIDILNPNFALEGISDVSVLGSRGVEGKCRRSRRVR